MNTLRIMSFVDESAGKELVLPVTPAKYTWRHPNRIETVRLDQLGEINLPGGAEMGSCKSDHKAGGITFESAKAAGFTGDASDGNSPPI